MKFAYRKLSAVTGFHAGDKLVDTKLSRWSDTEGQAFKTSEGHKLLLLNRRNREAFVTLPQGVTNYTVSVVDGATGDDAPRTAQGSGGTVTLSPFAVAVVVWK